MFCVNDKAIKRFWSKVIIRSADECWEWQSGTSPEGYGVFRINGKSQRAHRFAWFLHTGEMPKLLILHSCDNPPCVNPAHLREGTDADNVKDKCQRKRQAKGESQGHSKLKESQVKEIIQAILEGKMLTQIAANYGVSANCVGSIKQKRNWTHLTENVRFQSRSQSPVMPVKKGFKRCYMCRTVKTVNEFHKNRSKRDGLAACCKPCALIRRQENRRRDGRAV